MQEGFLLINKPAGTTSHDVVDEVRRITGIRKVGHGGTLDPKAEGLMVIGVGRSATKRLGRFLKDTKKTYVAEVELGKETDTYDSEGVVVTRSKSALQPSESEVGKVLSSFTGEIMQLPPPHSAIKIKGKKAYELAREGKDPDLKPRKVHIHSIKLIKYDYPFIILKATVGSGTYIRSLAKDIGDKLGIGAYLKALKRTRIGKFKLENAITLDDLGRNDWKDKLIGVDK